MIDLYTCILYICKRIGKRDLIAQKLNRSNGSSPKASSPVIADTGSVTMSTFHCTFLNHKIFTFIGSYLADFKHFEALLYE